MPLHSLHSNTTHFTVSPVCTINSAGGLSPSVSSQCRFPWRTVNVVPVRRTDPERSVDGRGEGHKEKEKEGGWKEKERERNFKHTVCLLYQRETLARHDYFFNILIARSFPQWPRGNIFHTFPIFARFTLHTHFYARTRLRPIKIFLHLLTTRSKINLIGAETFSFTVKVLLRRRCIHLYLHH